MKTYLGGRIELVVGDITKLAVGAIVNAANSALSGGGGVDGAIHRAAGPQLLEECRTLGRCPTGEARMTDGYRLPAKKVIHAVGPFWRDGEQGEDELLEAAYRNSLALMHGTVLRSIAFPSISTGIYGFPIRRAAPLAVDEVLRFLRPHPCVERVVFCCFSQEDAAIYRSVLDRAAITECAHPAAEHVAVYEHPHGDIDAKVAEVKATAARPHVEFRGMACGVCCARV
jgi:O-acetyl-ADP-ribose deacetylase (regulator of RNase III)